MKTDERCDSIWTREAAEQYYQEMKVPEPAKCKEFGCGRDLRAIEQLYGDKCFKCSEVVNAAQEYLLD